MLDIFKKYDYVVGVDPGYTQTWLVVIGPGVDFDVMLCRAYAAPPDMTVEARTHYLALDVLTKAYSFCGIGKNTVLFCIEDNHVTPGRSSQTALRQRELIGHMATEAWRYGFDVARVAPTAAKKSLTGSGRASKEDMVKAAQLLDGFSSGLSKAATEACADAVGIALAGAGIKEP